MTQSVTRTWLITGVSSGLGHSLAETVLARGDVVAGTVRTLKDKETFEAAAPDRALGFLLDVTDTKAVEQTVAAVEDATAGVDILVNNAGYCLVGAIEEASMTEIRAQFDVNVFGAIAVIQAVLPFMRRRRAGHIVNISSISGLAAWAGTGIYCASKFALEGATQTLAQEVGVLGIKVTNIEPGGIRTDFAGRSLAHTDRIIDDYNSTAHDSRRIIAEHLGHEPNDPKKVAQAVVKIVDSPHPPLHLLLGHDAMYYVGKSLGAFQSEMAEWSSLTFDTGFDESND